MEINIVNNKLQYSFESNVGLVMLPDMPRESAFKVGEYIAVFDRDKFDQDELSKMNGKQIHELAKTNCLRCKVVHLSGSYLVIGGRSKERIRFSKITIQFPDKHEITCHPSFYCIMGKIQN